MKTSSIPGPYTRLVDRDRFRRLVLRALRAIPPEFEPYLRNVDVVIEREPSEHDLRAGGLAPGDELFGLYVGVPLTERGGGAPVLPDRIVIFQGALERNFHPRDIAREVRRTVVHEVAHHFGIDDRRLDELGAG